MKLTIRNRGRYFHEILSSLFGFKLWWRGRATGTIWPEDDLVQYEIEVYWVDRYGRERYLLKFK